MNNPESNKTYTPKQALVPTPQLYDELVGDCMENLAKVTIAGMVPTDSNSVFLDIGCGTGAGTAEIVAHVGDTHSLIIKGVDIDKQALEVYRQKVAEYNWPAEAIKGDAHDLPLTDSTFSHAIGTAFLFVLPNDGVPAVKEIYRVLKPGGVAAFNSWAYVPNMQPIQIAANLTRPEGTPLPRGGMDKWENPDLLRRVLEEGGFDEDKITLTKVEVQATTTTIDRYASMLWSFIGGTSAAGWLDSDEFKWDEAIKIIKQELSKSDGYKELEGGKLQLKFIANIAIAIK
ncbi:S-adenosyl-L-methionine-dependent methyltransferase [Clohesyomyces aquaticus]|uniref:S-adenosyl-L-methionine-dependent methyltransferase n=1 Tax=Clohesyomyces aquaticus TaxID=1231657 RepID=A0A1Y2A8C6_9PLEO|nr:S-adenosyl-L-methionine-dependent methyltransferase [Clohesyomyces aquaticus]